MSILLANRIVPRTDRDSGSLRLMRLIELLLADGHRIVLTAERDEPGQHEAAQVLEAMGVQVHRPPLARVPLLDELRPDVAWLSFHDVAATWLPLLRERAPGARAIVDTVDVHWVRELREAELSGRADARAAALRTQDAERAVYSAADALVAVSADDAAALDALAPDVTAFVVSNVHPPEPEGPGFAARSGALFVGNYRHTPNVDAALWLAHDLWPRVRAVLPEAVLTLAGDAPPPEVQALAGDGIVVTGWIPETLPYLHAARVSVAPLRYGAGVKGKIGEALAHGLPVVTTAIGGEGMGLVDGEHALFGETAQALADAIVALHTDEPLWTRVSAAGRTALEAALSPAAARAGLHATLSTAAPPLFVADRDLDDAGLHTLLEDYFTTFAEHDPASLVLPVDDPDAAQALLARLVPLVATLGHDPDHIPDVALTPWPLGAPSPAHATRAGEWTTPAHSATPADAGAPEAPRFAVAARLPHDPADRAVALAALAASALPADAELLLLSDDGAPTLDGARTVPVPRDAGRRIAQARAVHATAAPVVVVLEPHALPEPGFAEPLVALVEAGATFAGPQIDGVHGLRVAAADGVLWPLDAEADAVHALPFDALAAHRDTWLALPPAFSPAEGMAEAQLGDWARERGGGVAVAADAVVRRQPVPPCSVVIATRNRSAELPDAIALLMAYGADDVIIADSASTDDTPQVAAALAAAHPEHVRVVTAPEAGSARARNVGIAAARHELVLCMDDDSRPAPGWVEGLTRELARPGVGNVGGPIAALWPSSRPAGWPGHGLERFHSALQRTDADETLVPPAIPYGANWGVRKSAWEAIGGFDPEFGPQPGQKVGGEESLVTWNVHRAGYTVRYVAAAGVGHRVSEDRISDRFVILRAFWVGIERTRITAALDGVDRGRCLGEARWGANQLLSLVPLAGDLRLEDAVEAVVVADLPLPKAVEAADALGMAAGGLLLTGTTEAAVGDTLVLRLDPQHLRGELRAAAAVAVAG